MRFVSLSLANKRSVHGGQCEVEMNITGSKGLHAGGVTVSADRTLTEMQQLEAMAAKLLETARKLSALPECPNVPTFLRRSGISLCGLPR